VTGSANIPNITGSLLGTASFANTATSSSFATTASFSLNVPVTSSYANNATSASFATTASYLTGYISPFPYTGSAIISGSLEVTGSVAVSNLQGTGVRYLVADASGSITAQSASAALKATQEFTSTAGQTTFTVTNGYATGYVDVYINGSKLSTSEFTDTSGTNIVLATGSFDGDIVEVVKYTPAAGVTNNVLRQLTTLTGSAGQTVFSASYTPGLLDIFYNGSRLSTSDYTANNGTYFTLATASAADDILDVLVYSYQVGAFNGIGGQGVVNQLAFFNTTSSITGSNSFTVSGNTLVGTASYTLNADTLDGSHLSILATTGSNTFTSAQYISNTSTPAGFTDTASLYTDGGIRATKTSYFSSSVYIGGDLVIFGSQSVNYITSSQLNIADNIITLNTSSPAVRFGGIAVQDSGSLATGLTGSLLWDSQNNHWIYTNPSGSSYSGGMLISGPRNTGSMGDEQGTTLNAIMKGMGGDHITSSGMFEVNGNIGIGTSSPTSLLSVGGSSASTATPTAIQLDNSYQNNVGVTTALKFYLYKNGTETYGIGLNSVAGVEYHTAGYHGFYTATNGTGSERMRITNIGNVGIGTSTVTEGTQAAGSISIFPSSSVSSAPLIQFPGNGRIRPASASDRLSIDGNALYLNNTFSGNVIIATGGGNVGIGTANPSVLFHVNGGNDYNTMFSSATSRAGWVIATPGTTSAAASGLVLASDGSFRLGNASQYQIIMYTNNEVGIWGGGSERMRVLNDGRVSIGTTLTSNINGTLVVARDQTYPNDVNPAHLILCGVTSTNRRMTLGYDTTNQYGYIVAGDLGNFWTSLYLQKTGGAVYAGSARIDNNSDRRVKDNIQPITGALDTILSMTGKKFHMIDEPEDKIRMGFIAQELQGIVDELVIESDRTQKLPSGEIIENVLGLETWGSSWAALLVEAMKELKAENDILKERLERNNIN
jgi:hypothetical protein